MVVPEQKVAFKYFLSGVAGDLGGLQRPVVLRGCGVTEGKGATVTP